MNAANELDALHRHAGMACARFRFKQEADRDDAFQAALLRLVEVSPQIDPSQPPAARGEYLRRTAMSGVREALGHRRKMRPEFLSATGQLPEAGRDENAAAAKRAAAAFEYALLVVAIRLGRAVGLEARARLLGDAAPHPPPRFKPRVVAAVMGAVLRHHGVVISDTDVAYGLKRRAGGAG